MDMEAALRVHYDNVAEKYEAVNQGIDRVLGRLSLPAEASVLDIGCGTGNLTFRLPEKGSPRRVVGVDVSDGVLDVARRHAREAGLEGFEFIRASALDLPFDDGEFDFVVSNMVFHLVPDQKGAYAEVVRVLKQAGRAVLQMQGGAAVGPELMDIFRRAWREVLPGREPPCLVQDVTAARVGDHLASLAVDDFDISWRHRVRRMPAADVPALLEFSRLVLGFWRWGVEQEAAERIDALMSRYVMDKAAVDGHLTNTVNVLLVEFTKPERL
ncbi:MAG: class I SAM-dependent methyltransferase [Planctomycetota bacterium]|jgi:SAM-dependent methyltransferase